MDLVFDEFDLCFWCHYSSWGLLCLLPLLQISSQSVSYFTFPSVPRLTNMFSYDNSIAYYQIIELNLSLYDW